MNQPRLFLALLWHQHQPCYRDFPHQESGVCFPVPWVRLHSLRDYYSMAAMVADFPCIHLTINLTPVLLRQIEDYAKHNATDAALDFTRTPTPDLTGGQREEISRTFFDADWHNEIYPHPRYKELFDRRGCGKMLDDRDVTDLRMWFNLAWFAPEFQRGEVTLPDGAKASVQRFIEKGCDFSEDDIAAMIEEQFKIMRNVAAIHRRLQDAGQIEVSTTPFYHPILPLLYDSDLAILDRDGARLPHRFARPEDAEAQTAASVEFYTGLFGRKPAGMWPAEGAVGESVISHFHKHGVRWIASDRGVLQRSGEWGYEAHRPELLAKAWRTGGDTPDTCVSIFFRDTALSDAIGFRYGGMSPRQAVDDFVANLKRRYATDGGGARIVSVILDGENAWGAYQQAGRPFFAELYRQLSTDAEICTVTFDEWLCGASDRGIAAHPISEQERVCKLAHASWIDECGSRPGNDLGTWIGEPDENTAWDMLREVREALAVRGATPANAPSAFEALYAAEGSDWFWWYGDDQHTDAEPLFDDLFRQHLRSACKLADIEPPAFLERHIVPRVVVWSFVNQVARIDPRDRFRFKAGCPGVLTWRIEGSGTVQESPLTPSGGVMAGLNAYTTTLGPFPDNVPAIEFSFKCGCFPICHCQPGDLCCDARSYRVLIGNHLQNTSS
jgi:alpha-amylase/alpha-mannosidase (GH57 family)